VVNGDKKSNKLILKFDVNDIQACVLYLDSGHDAAFECGEIKSGGKYNKYMIKMMDYYFRKAMDFEPLVAEEKPFVTIPYFNSLIEY